MKNNNSSSSSGGVGFFGLLTIVFIVLKLTGYIDWSWWWVLLPAYGPVTLLIFVILFVAYIEAKQKKAQPKIKDDAPLPIKQSKFKQRLDEVMARQKKENQN